MQVHFAQRKTGWRSPGHDVENLDTVVWSQHHEVGYKPPDVSTLDGNEVRSECKPCES